MSSHLSVPTHTQTHSQLGHLRIRSDDESLPILTQGLYDYVQLVCGRPPQQAFNIHLPTLNHCFSLPRAFIVHSAKQLYISCDYLKPHRYSRRVTHRGAIWDNRSSTPDSYERNERVARCVTLSMAARAVSKIIWQPVEHMNDVQIAPSGRF